MVYLVASVDAGLLWSFVKSFVLLCLTIEMFLWERRTLRCSRIGVVSFCPGPVAGLRKSAITFFRFALALASRRRYRNIDDLSVAF